MEGFTFDTRVEDLRHVWIPLSLKMSISKNQGLEINSWSEGEEVSWEHFVDSKLPSSSRCVINACTSKQLSEAEEAEGASLYDLVVTVPHIQDTRTGGNLVTHIKVGETYHQRKEVRHKKVGVSEPQRKYVFLFFQGVTHQQWYLFNDFLIEPIDKVNSCVQ